MSNPTVESRLAALEAKLRIGTALDPDQNRRVGWLPMAEAPKDRDILMSVQETTSIKVVIAWYQPRGDRQWRTITGQWINVGCALAWMHKPVPYKP